MNYLKKILHCLRSYIIWLKNIAIWSWDGRLFWGYVTLIILLAVFFNSYYSLIGNVLQLGGVITIVVGINNKIKLFNNESPFKYHLKYFNRFPRLKPKVRVGNMSANFSVGLSMTAKLTARFKNPEQSYADIIRYLDQELSQIKQQISGTEKELKNQIINLTKQFEDQRQKLDSNIKQVDEKLELSNTSDIRLELFGAACIAAGLIFSILALF